MSHVATNWAVEQKLPALQKLVLLMLADRHNKDTNRCDPSISRLAEDCGMSTDSVRAAIKALKHKGLMTTTERFHGPTQLTNSYTLNLGESTTKPLAESTPTPCPQPPTPLAIGHPNQEVELGKEPLPTPPPSGAMGVPAASYSDLMDASHMVAKAVVQETGLSGRRVYEAIRAQAEFELRKCPGDMDGILNGMVLGWEDYEACAKAGKLKLAMMGAEKFFGEAKWTSSKLWGLKKGENRKGAAYAA